MLLVVPLKGFLRPCQHVQSVHQVYVEPLSSDDWEILVGMLFYLDMSETSYATYFIELFGGMANVQVVPQTI